MIEQLKTNVANPNSDDFQYITDWESYYIGLENYNEKIRDEALRDARIEREQMREQARTELDNAVKKAKAEEKKHTVRNMRLKGFSAEQIADIADINRAEVDAFFEELEAEKP
jgi:DNA-directed RNA polymerase specialized sigma24 family protein